MIVKLLTEHHLECLSLKGGCRGSSESTHVKMPHCWKSHALAHLAHVNKLCTALNQILKPQQFSILNFFSIFTFSADLGPRKFTLCIEILNSY